MEEAGVGFFVRGSEGGSRVAGTVLRCGRGEGMWWGVGTGEAINGPEGYVLLAVGFGED